MNLLTIRFLKKISILCLIVFLLQSCATTSNGTESALQLVMLPIKIVSIAVGALIGAAAGMGAFPSGG